MYNQGLTKKFSSLTWKVSCIDEKTVRSQSVINLIKMTQLLSEWSFKWITSFTKEIACSKSYLIGQQVTCNSDDVIGDIVLSTNHVICTLPIGVLQHGHETLFSPKLPDRKVKAIFNIAPGTTAKYFISWDQPWRTRNDCPIMLAWTR